MAERRMFAKTIIDSDAFLDMPQSSQLVYFHLCMRADDDGFVNNPKAIMRNAGCKDDDLKLLFVKKFLIPFESGIVAIKHWKIHNYIRADRYKPTKYLQEKSSLTLDENNAYQLLQQDEQPMVNQMDTQVRLGKDRLELGKDSLDYYEQNVGALTSAVRSDMQYFIGLGFEEDLLIHCLSIAINGNARNKWTYAKSILKQLLGKDIKTRAQFQEEEAKGNGGRNRQMDSTTLERGNQSHSRLNGVTYLSADATEVCG